MENIKPVVCIGAALVDEIFTSNGPVQPGTSNPAILTRSAGGVARNVASYLAQLGHPVELITHLGNDTSGDWLMAQSIRAGIGMTETIRTDQPTGCFVAINQPDGQLFTGASSSHLEYELTPSILQEKAGFLRKAELLVIDCNLSEACIQWLLQFAKDERLPCIIEPVSIQKSKKLSPADLSYTLMISPNEPELCAIAGIDDLNQAIKEVHARGLKHLWIRSGAQGSTIYSPDTSIHLDAPGVALTDTTGGGDAALAGWIHGWLIGAKARECMLFGHALAGMVISVKGAELENLNRQSLETAINVL